MTRMYLRVPKDALPQATSPVNRMYFEDGTVVDFALDQRCGTCRQWDGEYCWYFKDYLTPLDGSIDFWIKTEPDFGCVMWEQRVIPILTETQQTDDTLDHVTPDSNPVIATGDTTEDMGY